MSEAESAGVTGRNNTQATAQFLPRFGTGRGEHPAADVTGALSGREVTSREDDGSIPLGNATRLVAGRSGAVVVHARIGDGPHGSGGTGSGDYDHYAVSARADQTITVDVQAWEIGSTLDSVVGIYDSAGTLLASNDDEYNNFYYGHSPDSFLRFVAPADDTYSVVVFDYGSGFQADPFDAASGGGAFREDFYTLYISLDSPRPVSPTEDDGAIPLANETGLRAGAEGTAFASARIGDGPHGSTGTGTGDFDFYRIEAAAGQLITVDTDTPVPLAGLDTTVAIYDSAGHVLAVNDDDFKTFDSYLGFVAPATGSYFVLISGNPLLPADPFNPSSGTRALSEGEYSVTISVSNNVDYYSFDLKAGDIFGAAVWGGAHRLDLIGPDGTPLVGTSMDETYLYPESSPLPGGGNAAVSYVIDAPGRYAVAVSSGVAGYTLQLRAFRPALEQQPVFSHQVLFLDFDGANVNAQETFAWLPFGNPDAHLSPLASFLPSWGLTAADESRVIDAVTATVAENLAADVSGVLGRGLNGDFTVTGRAGDFQIEILNSRDIADPFGVYPNVSRVIIGGTSAELGLDVIGIAQSIDVGNFDTSETAVQLLDFFSDPDNPFALENIPRADGATMTDLIGLYVGNAACHEAGHFFGNRHTDPILRYANIMNQFVSTVQEVRDPDRTFGTTDDQDFDFGRGFYTRYEGLTGVEDTLNTIAFGLSTGTRAGTYYDFVTGTLYVSGTIDDGHKDRLKVQTVGSNLEIYINGQLSLRRPAAGVNRVLLNGSSDDDVLDVSDCSLPVILMGRDGDDVLIGGRGRDVLIGGDGRDELRGGSGGDLLIGGHTAFDTDAAALSAILAEWSSGRSYEHRIANLRGVGNGTRDNGNVFLKVSGPEVTVFDDGDADELTGGTGRDWFFGRLRPWKKDEIRDWAWDEWVDEL
ncbi:MAG TPA: pre-peptidase C-terminal domain-containing protein [Gemmataceae bacterium]